MCVFSREKKLAKEVLMRKFKMVLFSALSVAIAFVFVMEVYAAVYLNINIGGNITYSATEIGARVWGTSAHNEDGGDGTHSYLAFNGSGTVTDNVYYVSGKDEAYSNINATVGSVEFSSKQDSYEIYVFIKNVGDRYILPNVQVTSTDTTNIVSSVTPVYFDISEGQIDPLETKGASASASAFISNIETEIANSNCTTFASNSSIDNHDVYCAKVVLSLSDNINDNGAIQINATFNISVTFMADIQYSSNDILSIYQEQNQADASWTKFGYNATLEATPTKIESNSLNNLAYYLDGAASNNGNTAYTLGDVYSESTVIYKDIDLVNVDIATGEIIGKLSDLDYNFEWYGREVSLEAGTTLASGRTLTQAETFEVDVYTYYPTIYARRWVVGNNQWISLSDKDFTGAVKIDAYYTATCEATIFDPDGDVAYNDYGIITRSYVNDYVPLVSGGANYLINNYGFRNSSSFSATASTTQTQMLSWANNLTKAWTNSGLSDTYKTALGVQGENWTVYVYNLLYLVKYAHNDSQAKVGYGNTYTYTPYYNSGVTVKTTSGNVITTGENDTYTRYESEKGSMTIGVYNSSSKGTATYDSSNKMSESGFNNAGMNYGYNSSYIYLDHKQGLYANQFLTYNNGEKRFLCDGYVGSDKYTSVVCLGLANPWGNIWTWVFGSAVISDGTSLYAYVLFEDYDAAEGNYQLTTNSNGFDSNHTLLTNKGYVQMTYNLPTEAGYYRYLGTSNITSGNPLQSLVGLPTADSSTASGSTTGLGDYYYCNNSTEYVFGVLSGGYTDTSAYAGAFCFVVYYNLSSANTLLGFRPSLILR